MRVKAKDCDRVSVKKRYSDRLWVEAREATLRLTADRDYEGYTREMSRIRDETTLMNISSKKFNLNIAAITHSVALKQDLDVQKWVWSCVFKFDPDIVLAYNKWISRYRL